MDKQRINNELFKFLTANGLDLNGFAFVDNLYTPLEWLFYQNNIEFCRVLLENGFRVSAINRFKNPLMCVVCMKLPPLWY